MEAYVLFLVFLGPVSFLGFWLFQISLNYVELEFGRLGHIAVPFLWHYS